MKKVLLFLALTLSSLALALSPLAQEFKRRRAVLFTTTEKEVLDFLKSIKKDVNEIDQLEILTTQGKFLYKDKRDVCFGDTQTKSLECRNNIGVETFFEAGDAD